MNHLPMNPLSPEEQQRFVSQMYVLLGKQVKSYHKHRHMGDHTSVPAELAQELMESIDYTVSLTGGICSGGNLEDIHKAGQEILEERLKKAKSLLELVTATAPQWQTECRWEALRYLRQYLDTYDQLHMAHREPDGLLYPILISRPEVVRGIDCAVFYLNVLWIENQIMAGVPENALNLFWDWLPPETLNPCEQLLINGMGKAILGVGIESLLFTPEEHFQIIDTLKNIKEERLWNAAQRLCRWLGLKDDNTRMYVNAVIPLIQPWTDGDVIGRNAEKLFV